MLLDLGAERLHYLDDGVLADAADAADEADPFSSDPQSSNASSPNPMSELPLLMLHGFPHDASLWDAQRQALSTHRRCIVPDLRGFGASTGRAYRIDHYVDDVVRLLDHLGVEACAVAGLSMGGYVAMAMWRRHADRIRAIALLDTRATADSADSADARSTRDALIAKAEREGVDALVSALLPTMLGAATHAGRPGQVAAVRAMMARQSVTAVTGALLAMRDRPDSRETLASITVPALVLVGDEDELTPVSDARAMLTMLPEQANARLEIIEGAGHLSCIERPAAVTHALADFLFTIPPNRRRTLMHS